MWLSHPNRRADSEEFPADQGAVTAGGDPAMIYLGGERRSAPVFGPAGYHWTPSQGDTVLVMKSGPEETPCVVGTRAESARDLEPGELWISAPGSGDAGILLRPDGTIELTGTILINGQAPIVETTGT